MRIAVLGATGATGLLVIEQALAQGMEVIAYARNPDAIAVRPGLDIVAGQLDDADALQAAIAGADGVMCCLGTHEKTNIDLMQKNLPRLIRAMQATHVPRLILLSAYGVAETAASASLIARIAYRLVARQVYLDKERSEALLPSSKLKWTIVCPVILTNGLLTDMEVRPMEQVTRVTGLPRISRANVALAMLDALRDDSTIGRKLLVTRAGTVR